MEPAPYEIRGRDARLAVLLVMGGDDEMMGPQIYPDFREMSLGVSSEVCLLALVDYRGEGASRVMEFQRASADPVFQLAEICTGDPRPISDFLARGLVSFGEETRFAIGFWGHGYGVFGDWDVDEILADEEILSAPLGRRPWPVGGDRSMLPDETSGNSLTNREARSALAVAFGRAGRRVPVDLLFFDTCLNGSVEVYAEVERFARVFVASSLLVDLAGWHYELWLRIARDKPPETAEEWAHLAVKAFEVYYSRSDEPAHLVAHQCEVGLVEAFKELVEVLRTAGSGGLVKEAGLGTASVECRENLDLGQLVRRIRGMAEADGLVEVQGAAERFLEVLEGALVSETVGIAGAEGLCGLTVWCPVYGDEEGVGRYYGGLEFARKTGWGELVGGIV